MTFEMISMGTPERDANDAACRRRSCGRNFIPEILIEIVLYEVEERFKMGVSDFPGHLFLPSVI